MFELDKNNKGFAMISIYLLVFYVLSSLILMILKLTNINDESLLSSLHNLITYIILLVGLLFVTSKDLKEELGLVIKDKKTLIYNVFASYGVLYVINAVINALITNLTYYGNIVGRLLGQNFEIISTSTNQSELVELIRSPYGWMILLTAGFIGPICEELVFRKGIFSICKSKEGALLISSVAFAAIHIISAIGSFNAISLIVMTLPYLFSGVAFGYIYIKNDCNIWIPTIVHALSNIISILAILFII